MSKIEQFSLGQQARLTHSFGADAVAAFAALTGDNNPVHLDAAYAATTQFQRPIVHGMLSAGLLSAVLGTQLPGPGTIYLQQTMTFKRPVYLDEEVTAVVTIIEIRPEKSLLSLQTQCFNARQELVLDGTALVKVT